MGTAGRWGGVRATVPREPRAGLEPCSASVWGAHPPQREPWLARPGPQGPKKPTEVLRLTLHPGGSSLCTITYHLPAPAARSLRAFLWPSLRPWEQALWPLRPGPAPRTLAGSALKETDLVSVFLPPAVPSLHAGCLWALLLPQASSKLRTPPRWPGCGASERTDPP